jgi:hypothetical protein
MFYEPVSVMTTVRAILSVATLFPLCTVTVRVMRIGDPFLITSIVMKLREELKEKTELLNYIKKSNIKQWQKLETRQRLNSIDRNVKQLNDKFVQLINQRRSATILDGVLKIIQVVLTFFTRRLGS